MAAQDVGTLVPRIRRALEGPKILDPSDPSRLSDAEAEAAAADAIADLILYTAGDWRHRLLPADGPPATTWTVDPELTEGEESLIAHQAALTYFFYLLRGMRTHERIRNEGQEWEYTTSANILRDAFAVLKEERDLALAAILRQNPVMARYASILAVRDKFTAAVVERWALPDGASVGPFDLILP